MVVGQSSNKSKRHCIEGMLFNIFFVLTSLVTKFFNHFRFKLNQITNLLIKITVSIEYLYEVTVVDDI